MEGWRSHERTTKHKDTMNEWQHQGNRTTHGLSAGAERTGSSGSTTGTSASGSNSVGGTNGIHHELAGRTKHVERGMKGSEGNRHQWNREQWKKGFAIR